MTKTLTQEDFKGAPDWVRSAAEFPKAHIVMIVNPLASNAEIERYSKQCDVGVQPIRLSILRTPDTPIGQFAIKYYYEKT